MVKKHTYEAVCPDGYVLTRTTARIYTHVIICRGEEGFGELSWAGNLTLAEKALPRFKNAVYKGAPGNPKVGERVWHDVQIIPCHLREKRHGE